MRKTVLVLVTTAAFMAVTAGTAAASHSWNDYHWARTANPLGLTIVDTTTPVWTSYVNTAVADWEKSKVLALTKTTGTTRRDCDPLLGQVKVCANWWGFNNWLGLATIWIDPNHHIVQGKAEFNDTWFSTATYNTSAWRHLVVCQEIAHDFGLDHQDETFNNPNLGTCMDYTNDPDGGPGGASETDPSNEHPNRHDYEQLVTIYTHLDSYSTALAVAAANPGLASNKRATPVATVRNDHIAYSVVTDRFADGSAKVTRIDWALR